jgi:hypothetical protein
VRAAGGDEDGMRRLVVSLCDTSGVWSEPYRQAGYRVIQVDLKRGCDVLRWELPERPWAVLAAPPCCVFCRPGARWWPRFDADGSTAAGVAVFLRCLQLCRAAEGWWALENPPGRHQRLMDIPAPAWQFQPFWYGDPWWKQTYVWGTAVRPDPTDVVAVPPTYRTPNGRTQGTIARMSSSWKAERERTPSGFARAFFAANP